jgi:hypothetical protein
MKSIWSLPNLLLASLVAANAIALSSLSGVSGYTFARALGICTFPVFGAVAWNLVPGAARRLKWFSVALTSMALAVFGASTLQWESSAIRRNAILSDSVPQPARGEPLECAKSPFADLVPECPQFKASSPPPK